MPRLRNHERGHPFVLPNSSLARRHQPLKQLHYCSLLILTLNPNKTFSYQSLGREPKPIFAGSPVAGRGTHQFQKDIATGIETEARTKKKADERDGGAVRLFLDTESLHSEFIDNLVDKQPTSRGYQPSRDCHSCASFFASLILSLQCCCLVPWYPMDPTIR